MVTSYTTLLMDLTSFTILPEHTARTSYGMRENSAVMKSVVSTKFILFFYVNRTKAGYVISGKPCCFFKYRWLCCYYITI